MYEMGERDLALPIRPGLLASTTKQWETLEIHSSYAIEDAAAVKHVHRHRARIRSLISGRFFERRYGWTGSGASQPEPRIVSEQGGPTHKLHGPTYREDDWVYYLVDLGRRMAVDEETWVTTEQDLIDEAQTFKPYFRLQPQSQLEQLSLQVTLPESLFVNVRPTKTDVVADTPLSTAGLDFETIDTTARLLITRPVLGIEYGISWL